MEKKYCSSCKGYKSLDEFGSNCSKKDGKCNHCKKCRNKKECLKRTHWADEKRIRVALYMAKYNSSPKGRYKELVKNAKKRAIAVDVIQGQFIDWFNGQQLICYYCSVPLTVGNHQPTTLTIDRKDNDRGYSLDNIALCCQRCNNVKSNVFTGQEMLEIADRYLKGKSSAFV